MAACTYNCTDLPNHEQIQCGLYRKGGFSAVGILECDHAITDFTNQQQYLDAIASDQLHILKGIKAQIPAATPVEGDNPIGCGSDTILDGFDRTVTWNDSNVSQDNNDFYDKLKVRTTFLILFNCNDDPNDTGEISVVEVPTSYVAFRVGPESSRERQFYDSTAKFSQLDEPTIFTAPADIFE